MENKKEYEIDDSAIEGFREYLQRKSEFPQIPITAEAIKRAIQEGRMPLFEQARPYLERASKFVFTPTQIQQFSQPAPQTPTESMGLRASFVPQEMDFQISPFSGAPQSIAPMPSFSPPQLIQPKTTGYNQASFYGRAGGGYGTARKAGFRKSFY